MLVVTLTPLMIFTLLVIFIGIISIVIGIVKSNEKPQEIIETTTYRYIPRNYEEDQEEPQYVSDIFRKMFVEESPWMRSVNSYDERKQQEINKYFIDQGRPE